MNRDLQAAESTPPTPPDRAAEAGAAPADSHFAATLPDVRALGFLPDLAAPISDILPGASATTRGTGHATRGAGFDRFCGIAGALEEAAAAIARLDTALAGHLLAPAWEWRARLEAVRRQAAADGRMIDPWHLGAVLEGVRFRIDGPAISDRGAVFDAARHALALWDWYVRPDAVQTEAIDRAAAALAAHESSSPLIGVALAVRGWLDHGGEHPPMRAALAAHWRRRGVLHLPAPLLTGAKAFRADAAPQPEAWVVEFLAALAEEAAWGLSLMRRIEREWLAARAAVRGRRRDSRAAAAIDILAATPIVSATSLAASLGIAVKNAAALLEGFVACGIAIEVTHRAKRRLFGLKHLAPLREETLSPRRAHRRTGRRGEMGHRQAAARGQMEFAGSVPATTAAGGDAAPLHLGPALSPAAREELAPIDFGDWMREAEQLVRRSQAILDRLARPEPARPAGSPRHSN